MEEHIPSIITAITATVSALIAFLGTFLAQRWQLKLKIKEISMQNSFKAREHVFLTYKKRIEESAKERGKFLGNLGTFLGSLATQSVEEREESVRQFSYAAMGPIRHYEIAIVELRKELKEENLFVAYQSQWEEAKQVYESLKKDGIDINNASEFLSKLVLASAIVGDLNEKILEHKAQKNFAPFLK